MLRVGYKVGHLALCSALLGACSSGDSSSSTTSIDGVETSRPAEVAVTTTAPAIETATDWKHKFDAAYVGPVHVTVRSDAPSTSVRFRWGPLERTVEFDGATATFWFRKLNPDEAGKEVFVRVRADTPVAVEYSTGAAPAGSIDINEGWIPIEADG